MAALFVWPLAVAIYLLFAGTISTNELVTAAVLAALAALWAEVIRRSSRRQFAFRRDALIPLLRALGRLPPATVRTAGVLLAVIVTGGSPGKAVKHRLQYGAKDDPAEHFRRAIAFMIASLAPDSFVIRVEASADEILIHQLYRRRRPPDQRWLG